MTQPVSSIEGRILDLSYSNAFQNLALEEALAKSNLGSSITTVRVWENPPSVILGRFQNPTDEVDIAFCDNRGIKIARRFTGGGAVFHDRGNLNLTIAAPRPKGPLTQLHHGLAEIILGALKSFSVEGSFVPPNTIEVSGKKISGGAAWVGSRNVLWHASILVSTDTQVMSQALSPSMITRGTNFVRSKWQPVTTLKEVVGRSVDFADVKRELIDNCVRRLRFALRDAQLTEKETRGMMHLFAEKYSKDDWNIHGHWKRN